MEEMKNGMDDAVLPEGWVEGADLFAAAEEPEMPPAEKAEEVPPKEEEQPEKERDFAAEVRQLQRLYPDFQEMPEEVAQIAATGESLLTAYAVWQGRQAQKDARMLREENRVLKQNAAAAAKAPLRGLGGTGQSRASDFERGFDSVI